MFIDFRVNPAFFKPIGKDDLKTEQRQKGFHLFKNSLAPIEHIENQMLCAQLDKLVIMSDDRRTEFITPLVSNDEIKTLENEINNLIRRLNQRVNP